MAELEVIAGDVTAMEVDCIANAANTQLAHGGGVAGAISRAGGPELQRESSERAPIGLGEAVETTAGDMPARWVIHAATMELGGATSADIIERATRSTLTKAEELGARSLALVAFGTGVGGFPLDEAARIMVGAARELPVADGGEGTMEVLVGALGGEVRTVTASDPLGRPVEAAFALLPDGSAVVETAQASGLGLVAEADRDAWAATTRGTGELIAAAVEAGAEKVIVTVGGSATTDGGAGALEALEKAAVTVEMDV